MSLLPKRPKLEQIGLKKYLDNTQSMHGGCAYDDFVVYVNQEKSKFFIANQFKVNRMTVYRWLELYEKELAND